MLLERLRDAFYFRRGEVIGGLALLIIVVIVVALSLTRRSVHPATESTADSLWAKEYADFERQCVTIDSANRGSRYYDRRTCGRDETYFRNDIRTGITPFDPNTIDSLSLVRMGFSQYVAGNIMRYRAKGGRYRTAEQFSRTYGLDSVSYNKVKGALVFAADTLSLQPHYVSAKRDTIVELNACDTTDLMKIRGIGRYWAGQIVLYGQRLGGYRDYAQLAEIEQMPPALIDTLSKYSTIDTSLISRINVNKASIGMLRRHPYLNFDKAKSIYDLRRMRVKLQTIDEIKDAPGITDIDYGRLKHYLTAD